jgi:hypothetical protein
MVNFSQLISFGGRPEAEGVSPMATVVLFGGESRNLLRVSHSLIMVKGLYYVYAYLD